MGIAYNTSIVRDGLVLYLDAANAKSYPGTGTTWTDLSGNGNNGTLVDGPTFGINLFTFDGLNDRVHISSPSNKFDWTPTGSGLNTVTFEMWIKTSDTSGNFFSKPWNGNGEYNYRLIQNQVILQIGNQSFTASLSSTIATDQWTHITLLLTPTQVAVYRNGTLFYPFTNHTITNNTPSNGNNNAPICLMSLYPYGTGWGGNTGFSTSGEMSSFKIYNRALSSQEVQQNFNALRGRYGV